MMQKPLQAMRARKDAIRLDGAAAFCPKVFMNTVGSIVSSQLRILATSDVHMHLTGVTSGPDKTPSGMAYLAHVIAQARAEAPGLVLLLDNGDALQGTPLGRTAYHGTWNDTHPLVATMAHLGYDAMGLGNHDFDFGVDYLEALCEAFSFPVLSANADGLHHVSRSVLLKRQLPCSDGATRDIVIGLTSALPQQTGTWVAHALGGRVTFEPALQRLNTEVAELKRAGADLVVLLAHSGFEAQFGEAENFAQAAAQIAGVDALIAGHTHACFPANEDFGLDAIDPIAGRVHGVPCVQPGYAAQCLGQIDLALVQDPKGQWQVETARAGLIYPRKAEPDQGIQICLAKAERDLAQRNAQVVGHTAQPLHSYFAMLTPNPAFGLLGQAMIDGLSGLELPDQVVDLPRLAAVAPAISGGRAGPEHYIDIPEGPVNRAALDQLCPYEDRLTAKVMTGADLRQHLERAAAIYLPVDQQNPDDDVLSTEMPGFCFDMIFGLSVTVDMTRPARFDPAGHLVDPVASRIQDVRWLGEPLLDNQRFLLAMTSYRAGGGGAYPMLGQLVAHAQPGPLIRSLVSKVLSNGFAGSAPDWKLHSPVRSRFNYFTGPKAIDHLNDLSEFSPEVVGQTPEGFLHLRLTL